MSLEQAEARAVRGCEAEGGSGCAVVGSQCASPGGQAGTWSGSEPVLAAADADTAEPEAERGMPAAGADQETPATDAREEEALPREVRVLVQKGLAFLGFDPGPADGLFGRRTRAAIWDWQAAKEQDTTGYLTVPEAEALAAVGMEAGGTPDMSVQQEVEPSPGSSGAASEPGEWRGTAPQPQILFFPTCGTDDATPDGCWRELSEPAGCVIWSSYHWDSPPEERPSWSGQCDWNEDNRAYGQGTLKDERGFTKTGELVAGMRQGHWVYRPADGDHVDEGPYVDGKRHGRWVWRGAGGSVVEGPYVDGKEHGEWVIKYRWKDDEGRVSSMDEEGPYVDGKKHGEWVKRWSHGEMERGPYVEGEKHGHWIERDYDGLVDEGLYVDGERHGRWVDQWHWWDNAGNRRVATGEGPYVFGKMHGHWVVRAADGTTSEMEYRNGEWVD